MVSAGGVDGGVVCGGGRLAQRAANYAEIVRNVNIGSRRVSQFLHQYHHVFWLGDLNYRTDFGSPGSDKVSGGLVLQFEVSI